MLPDERVEQYKAQLQHKINTLLAEFAEGKLNREQFHLLYERFTAQLRLAGAANLARVNVAATAETGPVTEFIRDRFMGKALGMVIYANKTGNMIETLGSFDVPASVLAEPLAAIMKHLHEGAQFNRSVQKISDRRWLFFAIGAYSSVITLFENEPSAQQVTELQRLHLDFESANISMFASQQFDPTQLAMPFLTFVIQRMHR